MIKLSIISGDLEIHKYSTSLIEKMLDILTQLPNTQRLNWNIKEDWFIDFILRLDAKSNVYDKLISAI